MKRGVQISYLYVAQLAILVFVKVCVCCGIIVQYGTIMGKENFEVVDQSFEKPSNS